MDIGVTVRVTAWLWRQGVHHCWWHQASGGLGRPRFSGQEWEGPAFRASWLPRSPTMQ